MSVRLETAPTGVVERVSCASLESIKYLARRPLSHDPAREVLGFHSRRCPSAKESVYRCIKFSYLLQRLAMSSFVKSHISRNDLTLLISPL
jgi:hypothetical protein